MRFEKRLSQAMLAVVLGAMASAGALAQSVTTRLVVAGGSATTATIAPGGSVSIEVLLDVVTAQLIGTGFTLSQTTPASNGFFSITGRSFVGSPFNDTTSGTPDATVLAAPSNLLDPTNNDNLGRQTVGLVGTPPATGMLAANLTLTASASTPLGTYTIAPTSGVSFASDDAFNDYDMSTGTPFTIVVGQTLTVNKTGSGTGTVTADSGPINCGATCSGVYPGTTVTLTAAPAGGSNFIGWSGSGCSGTGTCVVTVDAAKTVTAQFDLIPVVTHQLTVTKAGTGTGTVTSAPAGINCGADCSEIYAENTVVTLTAVPAASSTFAGWTGGGCSGTGTCVVTMSAAQSVQATFNAAVTLTVAKAGNGTGTVTSDVGGINCGSTCAVGYPNGTVVTLTAAAGAGQNFEGWSGGGCSGTGTCVVTLTAATTVTATFTDTTPPVTSITGTPSDPSSDPTPSFSFTSSEPNSTFLCSLDGATPTSCTSPRFVSVNNGQHVFTVQAFDQAGNPGNVASFSWTAAGIVAVVQPIPTLSEWALILLSLMMASLGLVAYRRRM